MVRNIRKRDSGNESKSWFKTPPSALRRATRMEKIVGVLFGLTDFCHWLYVTDWGVDRDYEGRGIGTKLMRAAHELAGGEKDIALYLVANEKAVPFYQKLGMTFADDVLQYNKIEWTGFTVQ